MSEANDQDPKRSLRIKERAYELWQKEGGKEGLDQDHWYRAEAEIDSEDGEEGDHTREHLAQ